MIKPDDKLASIIDAFTLAEWEQVALQDVESGRTRVRPPKDFRQDFASGDSAPVAVRWRRKEHAAAKKDRQKAKHDAMPGTKLKKAIAAARGLRREGATIREISLLTGLYWRTVLEHTKQDKP